MGVFSEGCGVMRKSTHFGPLSPRSKPSLQALLSRERSVVHQRQSPHLAFMRYRALEERRRYREHR